MGERIGAERRGQAADDIVVELAAERDQLGAFGLAQMPADRGERLAGDREVEPAGLRHLPLRAEHLHLVAVLDDGRQRHDAAVDLGAHRLVAQIGVDGIGEVDRRRALGQLDQLALRREGEDAILVHRHARVFEQLFGAARGLQDLDEVGDPAVLAVGADLLFLIGPMRGEAEFSLRVHLGRADLDLDARIVGVDHAGVQRAIAVAFGRRNVILEPPRHHRPAPMDDAERGVAILDRGHDRAERHDVRELLEADVALAHLAPDRIGMLLAPRHLGIDASPAEQQLQARSDLGDPIAAAGLEQVQPFGDRFIRFGFELREGERLHLLHELVHANPLGERGVDIHRLLRNPPPLFGLGDVMERAHVVQAVGELDQQNADVVRHGKQEFAQVLGGALVLGLRLDLGQLGDAIDQSRDVAAEQARDLFGRGDRILDRVVEDRGGDRLVVEPQVGEDARHLDRVAEIGVAAGALLGAMRLHREDIGAVEQRFVRVGVVIEDPIDQFILP